MARYNYQEIDRVIWINQDDKRLWPIPIDQLDLLNRTFREHGLPEPNRFPGFKDVYGYGQPPAQQKFTREIYPKALRELEDNLRKSIGSAKNITIIRRETMVANTFWDILEKYQEKYAQEIEWIRRMWYYRLFGKFIFINGKVTYIPGNSWYYLNFWYLDNTLPDYRDRDNRWWLAQKFLQLDTRTFKTLDKDGWALPNENGEYEMVDLGRKLHIGTANLKARRVGDTSKAECEVSEFITRTIRGHGGIQGKDETNGAEVFYQHFVTPYKQLPIIFKPMSKALDPSAEMVFDSDDPNFGLRSWVDFATSSGKSAYDGQKLQRYHADEPGKNKLDDVSARHKVVRQCMMEGDDVIGWSAYTTTVEEMNQKRGGANFLKIVNGSHFNRRDGNGQTLSALVVVFFRAEDGLKGFVGPYGESVINTPTPEQAKFIRKNYGAREYLQRKRDALVAAGDFDGLSEEKRQFPQCFDDCFTPPAKNTFFRMDILEARIGELQYDTETAFRGNFVWENDIPDTKVIWQKDQLGGRWKLSLELPEKERSRLIIDGGVKFPESPNRFVASSDAFRLEKTEGGRMSNGGGAVFWKRDTTIDLDNTDINDWQSHRFVCTYSNRPDTTDEYAEDMLMMSIYFGALMYPETNVNKVAEHFIKRGYGGFLLYDTDPTTGRMKNNPGFYSTLDTKKDLFNDVRDYIARHGRRDRHDDFQRECLMIKDLDDMTNWDLFTSCAGCLRGAHSQQGELMSEDSQDLPSDLGFEEIDFD